MRPGRRAAFLLLVCLALLFTAPAQVVAIMVEHACAGHCRIADSRGRAWAGNGRLFLRSGEHWFDLGRLDWQLPAQNAYLRIGVDGGEIVWRTLHRIDIDGIVLPATAILGHPALQLPASDWHGSLLVQATQLEIASGQPSRINGHGRIDWRDAATPLLLDHPLGDYRLDWQWDGQQRPRASFSGGRPGAIAAEGSFDGERLQARVSLQASARTALTPYISLIGSSVASGNTWEISLPLD